MLHEHDRFQELFDSFNLDEINVPTKKSIINELSKITTNVSKIKVSTDDADYKKEIDIVVRALLDYKEALDFQSTDIFLKIGNTLSQLPENNPNVNRICTGVYSHLYQISRQTNSAKAKEYLDKEKLCAQRYYEYSAYASRSSMLSANDLASALIEGGSPGELARAYQILTDAIDKFPKEAVLHYNLGSYYAQKKMFGNAMKELEMAKTLGDFSSTAQIKFFDEDPTFAEFRDAPAPSDMPDFRERLVRLRDMSK